MFSLLCGQIFTNSLFDGEYPENFLIHRSQKQTNKDAAWWIINVDAGGEFWELWVRCKVKNQVVRKHYNV